MNERFDFLPVSKADMEKRGIEQLDFVYIVGDAYVDHPSFGHAIISRVLVSHGYSVGIISQPDWHDARDFTRLGRPRLGFLISAGNIDSMVNHYTVAKKPRGDDAYTEGGAPGRRPDRATIVYANRAREAYRGVPIIIGGIEASLRRFAHYDYWDDKVRHSLLVDSGADILIYGMGERAIVEIADALSGGLPVDQITYVNGTCYRANDLSLVYDYEELPSYMDICGDKKCYAKAFLQEYREQDALTGKRLVQKHEKGFVVINPPQAPLTTQEMDEVYALPYARRAHPMYKKPVPALFEVKFSLTSCRGCFGACSFCALTFHQGRVIQSRSHESLVAEAELMTRDREFRGSIHDVGGPTADFRFPACKKQETDGVCRDRQCLGYKPCRNMVADHSDYTALLKKLRRVEGVKHVFVRSGVRYDYVMYDKSDEFLRELVKHHVSGRLKVAPEHVSEKVLKLMGKPSHTLYDSFIKKYEEMNEREGMEQFIVPYFMSSHPGADLDSAVELAVYLKKTGQRPEQVQDFYPTPGTLSTCMYFTGLDPRTNENVFVERNPHNKALQRALMQFFMPQNGELVREALKKAGRSDLIGFGKDALVPPRDIRHGEPARAKAEAATQPRAEKPAKRERGVRDGRISPKRPKKG